MSQPGNRVYKNLMPQGHQGIITREGSSFA